MQGDGQGRARTWPERAAAWPTAARWRRGLAHLWLTLASACKDAAGAEAAPGRLMPWLPVAFGLGIAIYFAAEREPSAIAAAALATMCATTAFLARRRPVAFPTAIVAAGVALGFATATLKAALIAHPVLDRPAYNVSIAGFVEGREERERSDRIVVRIDKIAGERLTVLPERVRLSVRRGIAPPIGTYVSLKARLNPPLSPLRPGGYDFARDLYFQRIGAVGFVTGAVKVEDPPRPPGLWLRAASAVDSIRDGIDRRIRAALARDAGAIASALITGKRDAISAPVNEAMYVSSLAHVLSISGYHMVLVAGVVFFAFRAGLALVPGVALRYPIKKWGALAALLAAAGYLVLSGAEVATRRAFVMTAIVLIAVMVDRAALTLRNLALAAFAVMVLAPEAVVHPSFQMSFAATLALVAAYERGPPWTFGSADTSFGARAALWGVRELAALVLASLVAGLATTPYAAYHFHRLAPYGVLANLLAMPIVSAWIMPAGLAALVAMPFGFDAPVWRLMGLGIDWMVAVALGVAGLPGAVGRIPAFGMGALLLATSGLIVLCLLRTRLRWAGAALIIAGAFVAARAAPPDVLIAAGGETVAVRTADGRLSVSGRGDRLVVRDWLSADGDARQPSDSSLKSGWTCEEAGCIARLRDGALIALARAPHAVAEDCGRADLVVTTREVAPGCATAIDRRTLRASGALALRRTGQGFAIDAARPPALDRPWARAGTEPRSTPAPPATRPATPRRDDIDEDD